MAEAARPGSRSTPLEEVRERYRAAEEAGPTKDPGRYVEALKAFLLAVEQHADAITADASAVTPLLDDAAMSLYRASNPELAERAVDLGLKFSPGASSLLHHKALVLLALNRDLPGVLQLVDRALEANPNDRSLWATRGDTLRLMGQTAEAVNAYLKAQELDPASSQYVDRAFRLAPTDIRVLRTKVDLARLRGGDNSALEALEELLRVAPNDPSLRLSRVEVLAALGRRDEALAAVRELRTASPDDPALVTAEARLLLAMGKFDEAAPLADRLVAAGTTTEPATLEAIAAATAPSAPELAAKARERLREADPRNVQNLLKLRDLSARLGKTDAALAAGRAVLAVSPDNLEAMRGIAEAQAAAGLAHDAIGSYLSIVRSHPHAVGEFRKGLELAQRSALPEAVREFAEAILLVEPKDAEARVELARGLAAAGDTEGALAEYDSLLDAHPGRLEYLLEKRALLSDSHDTAARLHVLDEIFRLDPTRTDVAVERGNLYLASAYEFPEQGSEREQAARAALVSYERALTDPTAHGVSLLGIARASRLVDDAERALTAYSEFLSLDGNAGRLDVLKEKAHTLREVGRHAEAAEEYKQAIVGGLEDADLFWGAAEVYDRLNQDALALRYLDLLVRRDAANPLYLRRRAQLLLRTGRKDEALKVLRQVVESAPADPHAFFEAAEVLRAQGSYADAIDYLRKGLAIDAKNRYGLVALAETLLLAGQYPEVVAIVDPLLKEDPNDVAAWKCRADAWRALGRPQEVVYSLQAILLLEPDNGPALLETFRFRRDAGDRKEAYEALTRLVRSNAAEAQDPAIHLERGDLAAALGLPEEANGAYERAASLDPSLALEIGLRRGRLRLTAGRPDLALEAVDEALHNAPAGEPPVPALLLRAEILVALERPTEARTVFEQVRAREPASAAALAGIAQAMIAEGRAKEAAAFVREVLPSVPPSETLFLLLSEAESGDGRLERASESIRTGCAALPKSVALWSRRGELAIAQKDWPEAAGAFAHALSLTPTSVELLLRAGLVAERLGHPNEAVALYDRATEASPSSKEAWTNRGLALVAAGRAPDALASFDRALALDSDHLPAKDGKKLAAQKMHDTELQRYGRDALLLEARLHRNVTKNDLFVLLRVPFEFLDPVLEEITRPPKVDLALLEVTERHDLENASYHLITAALDRRPGGVERRGLTLADVAVLAPSNYTLGQIQRLFGYLKSVLDEDLTAATLEVTPDVEDLARKALALSPENRTLFQLVRHLKVGVRKARLIKAVEEAGAAGHRPLPALDLGAYSPEFRKPETGPARPVPAEKEHEAAAPAPPTAPAPDAPSSTPARAPAHVPAATGAASVPAPKPGPGHEAGASSPGPASKSTGHGPVHAPAPNRCLACGGVASFRHACGANLCPACVGRFPNCPKCGQALPGHHAGDRPKAATEAGSATGHPSSPKTPEPGPKHAEHSSTPPEAKAPAPTSVPVDKPGSSGGTHPPAKETSPPREKPAPPPPAAHSPPKPSPAPLLDDGAPAPAKPRPKRDDEPRL